jgi:TPR repeat protein
MSSAISLASIYSSGYNKIKINMQLAVKYLSLAADAGWANAQGQLGLFLATGPEGVEVDPDKAFSLLTSADRRQDSLGTLGLGYCYFKGIGVRSLFSLEAYLPQTSVNLTRAIELLHRVSGPPALLSCQEPHPPQASTRRPPSWWEKS